MTTFRVTLTKRDQPKRKLSTGFEVDLFSNDVTDVSTLRLLMEQLVKDDIDVRIDPVKLIVEYHWQG